MKLIIPVNVEINLEAPIHDPTAGDPLEDRMKRSAVEAVTNALRYANIEGFTHDMEELTSIIFSVGEAERQP